MLNLLSEVTPISLPFICELHWVSSPVCCIHYILTNFHYFPHNYRSDIMLVPSRKGSIWKYSLKYRIVYSKTSEN